MYHTLVSLFWGLLMLAEQHRSSIYGNPCINLMEQLVLYQQGFIACFLNAEDTSCDSHEFRLNGAGLKLLWVKYQGRYWMSIAGDQKDLYPEFVKMAKEFLKLKGIKPLHEVGK